MADQGFQRREPAPLPPLVEPQRIFPKELWKDPQTSRVLDRLGLRPNMVGNIANIREVMESRIAREKAETTRLLAPLNRAVEAAGRTDWVKFVTLIAESAWGGAHREFVVHELHVNPYDDWNLVAVSNGVEFAREGDALLHTPELEAFARDVSADGLARIEAMYRSGAGDNAARDAARAGLKTLAAGIRTHWERESRALLARAR